MQRKGAEAHHFIESAEVPFEIDELVVSKIDWNRRHDHMQQHSGEFFVFFFFFCSIRTSTNVPYILGQHLISAIFERDFNVNTISWSLGQEICYIELNVNAIVTQHHIDTVERVCNELIAAATPVFAQILGNQSPDDVSEEVNVVFFFGNTRTVSVYHQLIFSLGHSSYERFAKRSRR